MLGLIEYPLKFTVIRKNSDKFEVWTLGTISSVGGTGASIYASPPGNNPLKYTDPDGRNNVAINSQYKMNSTNSDGQYLYTAIIAGDPQNTRINEGGCAVTAVANIAHTLESTNSSPTDVNSTATYVNNGEVNWINVGSGLDLVHTPGSGQFTHERYNNQQNDTANNYYSLVKVQYNAANDDHWVGVRGIHTGEDGTVYIIISPTSVNDSGFSANTNSLRYQQGWREGANGDVYVPVEKVNAYQIYSRQIEQNNTE
jgi:hypothetical protein